MADFFDPLYIITIISVSIAAIVGVFTIKNEIKKGKEEQNRRIEQFITSATNKVSDHVADSLKVVDTRLAKDEDDIADIETDMKQMVRDFKQMCDKLSRHDFIIDTVLPDFKALQKEFNHFKSAVDTELAIKGSSIFVKKDENDTNNEDKKKQ